MNFVLINFPLFSLNHELFFFNRLGWTWSELLGELAAVGGMLFEPSNSVRLRSSIVTLEGATCWSCERSFNNTLTLFWLSTLFLFSSLLRLRPDLLARFCFVVDIWLFLDLRGLWAHCKLLSVPSLSGNVSDWLTDCAVCGSGRLGVPMKLVIDGWVMIDTTSDNPANKSFTPLLVSLVVELSPVLLSLGRYEVSHANITSSIHIKSYKSKSSGSMHPYVHTVQFCTQGWCVIQKYLRYCHSLCESCLLTWRMRHVT